MDSPPENRFPRLLNTAAWIIGIGFVVSSLLRFYVNPSGGHTWRQSETLGMSMANALDMRQGGWTAGLHYFWEPRVLERGVLDGVSPSEFPLLDVVCGPFFLAGPHVGSYFGSCFVLLISILGALWLLPGYLKAMGAPVSKAWCVLLWLGCGTVGRQSGSFMPEILGFALMIAGMQLLLEKDLRASTFGAAIFLGNLGILVKPTNVVFLIPTFMFIVFNSADERRIARLSGLVAMLILPAGWYGWHLASLRLPPHGPIMFPKADFTPWARLKELGLRGIALAYTREMFREQFPAYAGALFIGLALWKKSWKILASYVLALIVAMSLDGQHILLHEYYFLGAGLCAMWLMADVILSTRSPRLMNLLLALFVCGGLLRIRYNLWAFAHTPNLWDLGAEAAKQIPPDAMVVTDDGPFAQKLLLVGRFGIIWLPDLAPVCKPSYYPDQKIAVLVDESSLPLLSGTACGEPVAKFQKPGYSWVLFVRPKLT